MSIEGSQPIQPVPPVGANTPVPPAATGQDSDLSFKEVLESSIREVNTLQERTEAVLDELRLGKIEEGHKAMSQIEKVDLAFKILRGVQEKLSGAYLGLKQLRI